MLREIIALVISPPIPSLELFQRPIPLRLGLRLRKVFSDISTFVKPPGDVPPVYELAIEIPVPQLNYYKPFPNPYQMYFS